jgi:hypothetical protein
MGQDGASAPIFRVGEQDGASAPATHLNSPRPYAEGIEYPNVGGCTFPVSLRAKRMD